jgi:hypothetical protein
MKRIIFFLQTFSIGKFISKIIFLLLMDLPTNKKLLMKDSPTEHFRW